MIPRNRTNRKPINSDETMEEHEARLRDFFAVPSIERPKQKKRVGPRWHEIRDLLMDPLVRSPDRTKHDPGEINPDDEDEDSRYHATLRSRLEAMDRHKRHLANLEVMISSSPQETVEDLTYWFNSLINRLGEDNLISRLLAATAASPFRNEVRTKVMRSVDFRKLASIYREVMRLAWIACLNKYIQRDLRGTHEFDNLAALNHYMSDRIGVALRRGPDQHLMLRDALTIMCKVARTSKSALASDAARKREARASGTVVDSTAAERQKRYREKKKLDKLAAARSAALDAFMVEVPY